MTDTIAAARTELCRGASSGCPSGTGGPHRPPHRHTGGAPRRARRPTRHRARRAAHAARPRATLGAPPSAEPGAAGPRGAPNEFHLCTVPCTV